MKRIKIKVDNRSSSRGAHKLQISKWLRDQGLVYNIDYDYIIMTRDSEIHYHFYDGNDELVTLFMLRWANNG